MALHERNEQCAEDFKENKEEHKETNAKFDKIFMDKLPEIKNCIKDTGARCHESREKGDKDLDKRKLNAKYFYVILGVLLAVVMGSVKYTYTQAQVNAEAHSEMPRVEDIKDVEAAVDENAHEIQRVSNAQIRITTVLDRLDTNVQKLVDATEK